MTKTKERRPTKREGDLAEAIERLERDAPMSNAEYSRFDRALNGLMRDVAAFIGDEINSPASINSGRLIAALERASRIIHDRAKGPNDAR